MRKTIKIAHIEKELDRYIKYYEKYAMKKYDEYNGTSQIPKNNLDAAVEFGKVKMLEKLLENVCQKVSLEYYERLI